MSDEIERQMRDIQARRDRVRGLVLTEHRYFDPDTWTDFEQHAYADIGWLLQQLEASRRECERLVTDNEFLRIKSQELEARLKDMELDAQKFQGQLSQIRGEWREAIGGDWQWLCKRLGTESQETTQ